MNTIDKLVELQSYVMKDNSLKEFKDLLQFLTNSIDALDKGSSLHSGDVRRLSKLSLDSLKEFSSFYESVAEFNRKAKSYTLKHDSYHLIRSVVNYFEFSEKRKKIIEKFNFLKPLLENENYIFLTESHKRFIETFRPYYENLKLPSEQEHYSLEERIFSRYLDTRRITNVDFDVLFTYDINVKFETTAYWSRSKLREDYKRFACFDNKVGELVIIESYEFSNVIGLVMSNPTLLPKSGKTLYLELLVEGRECYLPLEHLSLKE